VHINYSDMEVEAMSHLGFSYKNKGSTIVILRQGQSVTVLRGAKAMEFEEKVSGMDEAAAQQLMARVTGNYKRGNEKRAKSKHKNKYGS